MGKRLVQCGMIAAVVAVAVGFKSGTATQPTAATIAAAMDKIWAKYSASDKLVGLCAGAVDGDHVESLARSEALTQAISQQTERERLIVHLRFVEEQTQSEIGLALGVSQMQVSRLLSGILARLRRHLSESVMAA